jgi:hypothetical protein
VMRNQNGMSSPSRSQVVRPDPPSWRAVHETELELRREATRLFVEAVRHEERLKRALGVATFLCGALFAAVVTLWCCT